MDEEDPVRVETTDGGLVAWCERRTPDGDEERAAFISLARSAVPELLAEVERLRAGKFSPDELDDLCHGLSIDEIARLRDHLVWYISKWFGFDQRARVARTPEWEARAAKRLVGKTETCCECCEEYPAADLQLGGEVFCPKCREKEKARIARRK